MADEYADAVTKAARLHRRSVARLVEEVSTAENLSDVEPTKAELTTAKTSTKRP